MGLHRAEKRICSRINQPSRNDKSIDKEEWGDSKTSLVLIADGPPPINVAGTKNWFGPKAHASGTFLMI